ncbi:hypothetical protein ACMFMG_011378 [Clarireedia jacksonii]
MFSEFTSKIDIDGEGHESVQACSHCGQRLSKISSTSLQLRSIFLIVYGMIITVAITAIASIYYSGPNRTFLISSPKPDAHTEPSLYFFFLESVTDKNLAPFIHGLRYGIETTPSDYWDNDLYMGKPSDESEQAWNYLIHPNRGQHGIRLLREEATRLNISQSIRLTNNNLAVVLQVHHNLHCLRRLRQMFYEDHYYPNWSEEDQQRIRAHNLHCMESLRTSTICRPDLAPLPFYWSGNDWHQMNVNPQVERECVDWNFFQDSVKSRSYDTSELVRDRV